MATHRGTAVPKFGTWDEKDPSSGDGFTVIFNKVKEEKRNASANFLTPPQQNTQKKHGTCCSTFEAIGKRFVGKVAIVTASTQGIGLGIAERLADRKM